MATPRERTENKVRSHSLMRTTGLYNNFSIQHLITKKKQSLSNHKLVCSTKTRHFTIYTHKYMLRDWEQYLCSTDMSAFYSHSVMLEFTSQRYHSTEMLVFVLYINTFSNMHFLFIVLSRRLIEFDLWNTN